MVIRILRAVVRAESAHEFRARILRKMADARQIEGVIDVHIGSQTDGAGDRFIFVSRWQSIDALYAWAGGADLLARPVYFDGLDESVVEFDIQHYVDIEAGV